MNSELLSGNLFPDPNHPLFTTDTSLQGQIVDRIKQAQSGKQIHRKGGKGDAMTHAYYGLPKGLHPQISNGQLGNAWGLSRQAADNRTKHPEKLDPFQVRELCRLCGVTLDWLRYGGENSYGKFEEPETVASIYNMLSADDKALICQLLARVAGPDLVSAAKAESWIQQSRDWYEHHPEKAELVRAERVKYKAQTTAQALGLQGRPDIEVFLKSLPPDESDA